MNNSSKRILKVLTISLVAATTLTACGSRKLVQQKEYIQPVYEEEALFVKKYDQSYIDVMVGDSKKMYKIPKKLESNLKDIRKNDKIIIEYSLDNELKRDIKDIKLANLGEEKNEGEKVAVKQKTEKKEVLNKPKNKEKEKKPKKEKKRDNDTLVKLYSEGEWKEEKASKVDTGSGYEIALLKDFEVKDGEIYSKKNNEYSLKIDIFPEDTEIKPLRWDASDELKKTGELKEIFGEKIYDPNFRDAEFVFTSNNGETEKLVVVKKKDDKIVRYSMSIPFNEDKNLIESSIYAMMESAELN